MYNLLEMLYILYYPKHLDLDFRLSGQTTMKLILSCPQTNTADYLCVIYWLCPVLSAMVLNSCKVGLTSFETISSTAV